MCNFLVDTKELENMKRAEDDMVRRRIENPQDGDTICPHCKRMILPHSTICIECFVAKMIIDDKPKSRKDKENLCAKCSIDIDREIHLRAGGGGS